MLVLVTISVLQTPLCVHEDLDCVSRVAASSCLERCHGLILNLMKTSDVRQDKEQYKEIFDLYEKYKSPNVSDFSYFKKDLYDLRGKYGIKLL